MARQTEFLLLGALFAAACTGGAATAVDGGHDGSNSTEAGADAEAGLQEAQAPDANDGGASDALGEAAAAFCAPYLDASDPATVCVYKNCCSLLFACNFSQPCNDYNSCVVNTPLDAAPPDASFDTWVLQYCMGQYPEGGALSVAGTDCVVMLCGDSGLGH